MKATFDLPDDLLREVKLRAVIQRRTARDIVAEFIRQGLGMETRQNAQPPAAGSMVEINEFGLPVFRCRPSAPATKMSVEQLLEIEQEAQTEEDLKRAGISV